MGGPLGEDGEATEMGTTGMDKSAAGKSNPSNRGSEFTNNKRGNNNIGD
jgi:hypothetical protein